MRRDELPFLNQSLFMKLGKIRLSDGSELDGEDTILAFEQCCREKGSAWMGIDSLRHGMQEKRAAHFQRALEEKQRIRVYFAIHNEHYDNDIAYEAVLEKLINWKEPVLCPEPELRPEIFRDDGEACLWLKLKEIRPSREKAENYLIASTGRNLKWTICNSRYFFGYIEEKE